MPRSTDHRHSPDRTLDPSGFTSGRVSLWLAFVLWFHATRDRRSGLPGLLDPDTLPAPTPFVGELDHRRLEVIEAEHERLRVAVSGLRHRGALLDRRITEAREHTAAGLPIHRARVGELEAARAQLDELIAQRCTTAQRRCLRFDEYTRRCCARYARTLVRRHPEGAALAQLRWPSLDPVPAWVVTERPAVALFPLTQEGAR